MMGTAEAIAALAALINAAVNALGAASQIGTMIQTLQSQNRTTFTDAEWATIDGQVAAARAAMVAANAAP
jgi:hypothetical protein